MTALGWIASSLGIVGALLNARRLRCGFYFYIIANILLIYIGFSKDEMYNVVLFSVFILISSYGLFNWR
jgi:nicotinamide riboside transporter PnuC